MTSVEAGASGAGIVTVLPVVLVYGPTRKRYQYVVAGASPVTSTWTEWASSGDAVATPEASVVAKSSLVATSQTTRTSSLGMPAVPPLASGSGARRVQRITASGNASPDAT